MDPVTVTALSIGANKAKDKIDSGLNKLSGVHNAGNLKQNVGVLHPVKEPYVIIRRKKKFQSSEDYIAKNQGLPSNVTQRLGDLQGYTRCKAVHVNIPNATKEECDIIERYLKEGVIL